MDKTLLQLIEKVFKKDGILSKYFPSYVPRDPQIEMAEVVCRCLLEGKNGLIEAGTGTGKSLGYAIAAALWSAHYQKKIVLSTFTVTLQGQLVNKDLPIVKKVLRDLGYDINYEVGKGRSHYICKRRFFEALADPTVIAHPQYASLSKLSTDLDQLEKGDRTELDFDVPAELWKEINGDSNDCLAKDSPHFDGCFIQQARSKLQAADIIVSNHALFFADLQLKQKGAFGLFPEYDAVIFDEGHRIEDIFSKYFTKKASVREIEALFQRSLDKRSIWSQKAVQGEWEDEITQIKAKALRTAHAVFSQLSQRMVQLNTKSELLKAPLLETNPFVNVLDEYGNAIERLAFSQEWDNLTARGLENMLATIERVKDDFDQLIFNKNAEQWANWINVVKPAKNALIPEVSEAYDTVITGAPIEANAVLGKVLFSQKTCILTSATLTTSGNFNFVAERLGINEFIGYKVASPFDYEKQSLLIVPKDGPVVAHIKEILTITGGRTFILFTSFSQMREVKEQLDSWLQEKGITPLIQAPGVDRDQLINEFKSTDKAVLFGAESFWEGVDVPGDDLICVVIVRLPFAVPTEPLVIARCNKIEEANGDPFTKYSLPNCILRMKQGYGRLIRTTTDRGAVIILDNRVMTKRYGRVILNSLPSSKISRNISDLAKII